MNGIVYYSCLGDNCRELPVLDAGPEDKDEHQTFLYALSVWISFLPLDDCQVLFESGILHCRGQWNT